VPRAASGANGRFQHWSAVTWWRRQRGTLPRSTNSQTSTASDCSHCGSTSPTAKRTSQRIGGISAFPNVGMYQASKWALEGISQAMAQEVSGFGVKVTLIEPGGFATDWAGASARDATALAAYEHMKRSDSRPFNCTRSESQARRPNSEQYRRAGRRRRRRASVADLPRQWQDVSTAAQGN